MPSIKEKLKDPFTRSTWNVMAVQALFVLLILVVLGFAIWHQQNTTQSIIDYRRAVIAEGQQVTPQSLDTQIGDVRDDTLMITAFVLLVLALAFGYLSARYALNPTRNSLAAQKRFIGNLAHELRTPLAIIRTNTEVALMDKTLEGYARDTLTTTLGELDRVSGIINNLLSFDSLMNPGQIKLEPLLLREVAGNVVRGHMDLAKKYGIAMGVDAANAPAYVMGNQVALEQAITNLVKNALNYTPQHAERSVVVRIDDLGDEVSLSVIDSGIGIAQKDLFSIFQPFYRGDTSRERGIGSGTSGLGLAIVNDIVRAHKGHIVVRSALNRGTTIILSFPKAPGTETGETKNAVPAEDDDQEHEELIA